jgi:hypothetical protein
VLKLPLKRPIDAIRARKPKRLPTVLTKDEALCQAQHNATSLRLGILMQLSEIDRRIAPRMALGSVQQGRHVVVRRYTLLASY